LLEVLQRPNAKGRVPSWRSGGISQVAFFASGVLDPEPCHYTRERDLQCLATIQSALERLDRARQPHRL
jgi:hypothetical protein